MKKHFKIVSKKIMILTLVASLVFTSVFSSRKMEARATSVAVGLGSYTLYQICLYFGSLAVTSLGLAYVYDSRDEIAEFGKTVIDSMKDIPTDSWLFGSYAADGNYVYGTEALQEVQDAEWTVIQGGGQSPKNDNDNDGDKDEDDLKTEFNLSGYFLLESGKQFFIDTLKPLYDSWVNKESNNPVSNYFSNYGFSGFTRNSSGKYEFICSGIDAKGQHNIVLVSDKPIYAKDNYGPANSRQLLIATSGSPVDIYDNGVLTFSGEIIGDYILSSSKDDVFSFSTNMPVYTDYNAWVNAYTNNTSVGCTNALNILTIADWINHPNDFSIHFHSLSNLQ